MDLPFDVIKIIIWYSDTKTQFQIFATCKYLWNSRFQILDKMVKYLVTNFKYINPIAKLIIYGKSIKYVLEEMKIMVDAESDYSIPGYGDYLMTLIWKYGTIKGDGWVMFPANKVRFECDKNTARKIRVHNSTSQAQPLTLVWKFVHHNFEPDWLYLLSR